MARHLSDKGARTERGRNAPTMMIARRAALFLLALSSLPALCAPQADPLNSAACNAARAELEAAIDQAAPGASAARFARARRQAAMACLGRSEDRAVRSGAPEPVQRVPAPAISTAPRAPSVPPVLEPPPALAVPRPTVITICDPAGCWDSEGRRLNNLGPLLMGPRGACTVQGGLASCP